MATYYVDPAATGANDGSSWTDAWTSVQTAFDTAVVSDKVYCRGTQTLTASIDVDTQRGSVLTGVIHFIGCNASGVVDGTRFVLDGNSTATNCLRLNDADYYVIESFECKNATSHGVEGTGSNSSYSVWINCSFNNNGGSGFYLYIYGWPVTLIRCAAYSNNTHGIYVYTNSQIYWCRAYDNGSSGFQLDSIGNLIIGSIAYDNVNGIYSSSYGNSIIGNVVNGNTSYGIYLVTSGGAYPVLANRITNSGTGLHLSPAYAAYYGYNYFDTNTTDIQNSTLLRDFALDGDSTNLIDQGDTNQGYTSLTPGSEDFNLRSDATLRRTAITIPET